MNNPFGEDIYTGKVIDDTNNAGISAAQVIIAAKKKGAHGGYSEVSRCMTDADGNYVARYRRENGRLYRIYAQKEFYSDDDPYNYAWGDHKNTTVKLKPYGFLKVRTRNITGKYESLTFRRLIGGSYPSIDARVNPDTVICCFRLFAGRNISLDYILEGSRADALMQGQEIHLKRSETDSICIDY